MSSSTDNVFARVLVFYEDFRRNKLLYDSQDLVKITRKYGRNSSLDLIADLSKKYQFSTIPSTVKWSRVIRILNVYEVPSEYCAHLNIPSDINTAYDKRIDFRGDDFDAEYALSLHQVWDVTHTDCKDNLSKTKHLVPGYSGHIPISQAAPRISNKSTKLPHIFESIASEAISDNDTISGNPFSLLMRLKDSSDRARVVVRNKNEIRGTLDGVIVSFDKCFNMLMRDVEESYRVSRFDPSIGQVRSENFSRSLPQILVRGDLVVSIYKAP